MVNFLFALMLCLCFQADKSPSKLKRKVGFVLYESCPVKTTRAYWLFLQQLKMPSC